MATQIKTAILLMVLASCIIYTAGCKKSAAAPASIVGAWTVSSITSKLYVHNVLVYDTTVPFPGTTLAITFNSDGFFTELTGSGVIGSAYTFTGSVLSLFDTVDQANLWGKIYVPTLTANKMSFQDTSYFGSDSVELHISNLTR